MHPNGQIPAYEFAFGDVNPPVHAWACWRVYKMTGRQGPARPAVPRARVPEAAAQLHLVGEPEGPRGEETSSPAASSGSTTSACSTARSRCPTGGHLEQADGTAWMAFYCNTMLAMALELASEDPAYEDLASKFFEHFIAIARRHEHAGRLRAVGRGRRLLLRPAPRGRPARAAAGPLAGGRDPADRGRGAGRGRCSSSSTASGSGCSWFLENRPDVDEPDRVHACRRSRAGTSSGCWRSRPASGWSACCGTCSTRASSSRPHGIRSVSRVHREHPYEIRRAWRDPSGGLRARPKATPACSAATRTGGGRSGSRSTTCSSRRSSATTTSTATSLKVECPDGLGPHAEPAGGRARSSSARLAGLFLPTRPDGVPATARTRASPSDPHWKDLVLFHEYFHGDTGRGVGASHQTGWTALVLRCIEDWRRRRARRAGARADAKAPRRLGWRAGDEPAHRGRRPHRMARGRRPGRLRLGHDARRAHPALPRAAAGGDDAADRAHGAGQRAAMPGSSGAAGTPAEYLTRQRYAPGVVAPGTGPTLGRFTDEPWPTWTYRAARRHAGSSRSCSSRTASPVGRASAGGCRRRERGADARRAPVPLRARLPRPAPREPGVPLRARDVAGGRCTGSRTRRARRSPRSPTASTSAGPAVVPRLPVRRGAGARARLHEDLAAPGAFRLDLAHGRRRAAARGAATRRSRRGAAARSLRRASRRRSAPAAARFGSPLERAADAYIVAARRGQDDHRRLSLVHRLGPRHVHRPARALPRHRPAGRRARRSCSSGPDRLGGHAAEPLRRPGRRARVQLGRRLALVRRRGARVSRGARRGAGRRGPARDRKALGAAVAGDPRRLRRAAPATASGRTATACSPPASPACSSPGWTPRSATGW